MLNQYASDSALLDNLKWLAKKVVPGDQVVFYFSGHGTRIPTGPPASSYEDAIVLGNAILADGKFFKALADVFKEAGVNITLVFDSCYSGGMSRGNLYFRGLPVIARPKFLKAKVGVKLKPSGFKTDGVSPRALKPGAETTPGVDAFLFASADGETATDLHFQDPSKPSHGLFSLLLLEVFGDSPTIGVGDAIRICRDAIKKAGFEQTPWIETSDSARATQPLVP
jgi:hypothetical protein